MLNVRHYYYSHMSEYYSWFSQGIDSGLQKIILSKKTVFKADESKTGQKCFFQVGLDGNNIAIGLAESVQDNRPCIHEHMLVLSYQEYSQLSLYPSSILNRLFVNYTEFLKKKYKLEETLPLIEVDESKLPTEMDYSLAGQYFLSEADLSQILFYMLEMNSESRISMQCGSFEDIVGIISVLLSVMPSEISRNTAFFGGVIPEEQANQFSFWFIASQSKQQPIKLSKHLTNNQVDLTYLSTYLARAVYANNINSVKTFQKYYKEYSNSLNSKQSQTILKEMNTLVLSSIAQKIRESERGRSPDSPDANVMVTLEEKDKKLLGSQLAQKARDLFQVPEGDLNKALELIEQSEIYWPNQADIIQLKSDVLFLNELRQGNITQTSAATDFVFRLDKMEFFLSRQLVNSNNLIVFFTTFSTRFRQYLAKGSPFIRTKIEFDRFQEILLLKHFTYDGIKNHIQTIIEGLEWLDEVTDINVKNNTIHNIVTVTDQVLNYEVEHELKILLRPETGETSLIKNLLPVLLVLKKVIGPDEFQRILIEYIGKLVLGIAKKDKKFNGQYDYKVDTLELNKFLCSVLVPNLKLMGWPQIHYSKKEQQWSSDRLERIVEDLKQKHGNVTSGLSGSLVEQTTQKTGLTPETSDRPPQSELSPKHIMEVRFSNPTNTSQVWELIRNNPNIIKSVEKSDETIAVTRIFEEMDFNIQDEIHILVNGPNQSHSLFVIVINSLGSHESFVDGVKLYHLLARYIDRLVVGIIGKQPITWSGTPRFEYNLPVEKIYQSYMSFIGPRLEEIVSRIRLRDNTVTQSYNNLNLIIADMIRKNWANQNRTKPLDREYHLLNIDPNIGKPITVLHSEISSLVNPSSKDDVNISMENARIITERALSKLYQGSLKPPVIQKIELHDLRKKQIYVIRVQNGDKTVLMVLAMDGSVVRSSETGGPT